MVRILLFTKAERWTSDFGEEGSHGGGAPITNGKSAPCFPNDSFNQTGRIVKQSVRNLFPADRKLGGKELTGRG